MPASPLHLKEKEHFKNRLSYQSGETPPNNPGQPVQHLLHNVAQQTLPGWGLFDYSQVFHLVTVKVSLGILLGWV